MEKQKDLKKNLPAIEGYAARILEVHGLNHNELFTVHKLFNRLKTDLEQHLIKEETILFPIIKSYESSHSDELPVKLNGNLMEIEAEREDAGHILKELRKTTNDYKVPDDGCNSFRLTYEKLQNLEADLFRHIHLENNILFKGFGRASGN